MIPLVDLHCHLLAGLDDGPGSLDEAVRMCQRAWDDGIRSSVCLAHMSDRWPRVTPQRIRKSAEELKNRLREIRLPLSLYPAAEVAVRPDLDQPQMRSTWMGMADRTNYLLLEIPYGGFVDIRSLVIRLQVRGVRTIVAHPERYPELLYDAAAVCDLITHGALMQVTADAVTDPPNRRAGEAIKRWVLDGMVHLLGSDGHSAGHRPPLMSAAYHQIANWAGPEVANRICGLHGLAVLEGRPLRLPLPKQRPTKWFAFLGEALSGSRKSAVAKTNSGGNG